MEQPRRRLSPFLRKLALSAGQSALFNHYLAMRVEEGLLRKVLSGDVMGKWPFGGMFVAHDLETEQARLDARETVPSGPIFGRKLYPAEALAAAREAAVLENAGLTLASFQSFGKLLQGTRRHNLIYPEGLNAECTLEGVRLSFSLPAGSYATVLLQEVMKTVAPGSRQDLPLVGGNDFSD
jgi:tRNA pseudouridine13 synthase